MENKIIIKDIVKTENLFLILTARRVSIYIYIYNVTFISLYDLVSTKERG